MSRRNRKYFKIFKGIIIAECFIVCVLTAKIITWAMSGDKDDSKTNTTLKLVYDKSVDEDEIVTEAVKDIVDKAEPVANIGATKSEADNNPKVVIKDVEDEKVSRGYTRDDVFDYESIEPRTDFECPEMLEGIYEKYPQTIMFYNDYPDKKDIKPADNIGSFAEGEIPLVIQWDDRWGYSEFGDFVIGTAGCGPTCLSMVMAGLTGDNTITPVTVGKEIEEANLYAFGAGTDWVAMSQIPEEHGISVENVATVRDEVYTYLEEGKPIICSVGPGDFTVGGHFIVLAGLKDGKILINDPNSIENSKKLWDYDEFENQISNMWVYSLD